MSWPRVVRRGLTVGIADIRVFWSSWRVWVGTHALRTVTTATMWILLGRLLDSPEVVRFLLVGQVATIGPWYAGWAVQVFTWDRLGGTYPMLVASPASLVPIMLGRTSVCLLNGMATSLVMLVVLVPLFAPGLPFGRVLAAAPLIAVLCLTTYAMSFCLGSLINWIPRLRNVVQNVVMIVITGICGVVVPLSFWSGWVQGVAQALPITHGLQAIRLLLAGGPAGEVALGVAIELLVGLVWFAAGVLTLDATVTLARRSGAIELT